VTGSLAGSIAAILFSFFYSHGSIKFCTYQEILQHKSAFLRSIVDTRHYFQLPWCSITSYRDR